MKTCPHPLLVLLVCFVLISNPADAEKPVRIDLDGYDASSGVIVKQHASRVHVTWPMDVDGRRGCLVFDLNADAPLIQSIGVGTFKEPVQLLAEGIDPVLFLRVGNRDLEKRNGWTIFFDRMQNKPNQVYRAEISRAQAVAKSHNGRVTLTIGNVKAGPFQGKMRWTFYVNCPFVLQEAVLSTERPRTAFLYDTGVVFRNSPPEKMTWKRSAGGVVHQNPSEFHGFETVAVKLKKKTLPLPLSLTYEFEKPKTRTASIVDMMAFNTEGPILVTALIARSVAVPVETTYLFVFSFFF